MKWSTGCRLPASRGSRLPWGCRAAGAATPTEAAKLPRWGGFLSFLVAILRTIFLFPNGPTVRLDYDGQSLTTPTLMVSIMNGRRPGGGVWVGPAAPPGERLVGLF